MNVDRTLIIFSVLFTLAAAAIADQDSQAPNRTVCLSQSSQVSVTLQRPEGCASEELVIVAHERRKEGAEAAQRELLQWVPPCGVTVASEYRNRVRETCDPELCQLQLQLTDVTVEDQGQLVCRNGAMSGPPLDKCGADLRVVDVADLQQSCSYSPTDRTVRCDKVTSEVKIFHKGEWNDRVVGYSSEPFHFQMGDHEEGRYAVTQETKTEEDALCSRDFEFHVEKRVQESADAFSTEQVIWLVFIVVALCYNPLYIIVDTWRVWRQ